MFDGSIYMCNERESEKVRVVFGDNFLTFSLKFTVRGLVQIGRRAGRFSSARETVSVVPIITFGLSRRGGIEGKMHRSVTLETRVTVGVANQIGASCV